MAHKRDLHQSGWPWEVFLSVVDSASYTVGLLLTAKRDLGTARRFLERSINPHVVPEKITIDKCGVNTAAIGTVYTHASVNILIRQNKHFNNTVERDHRAIKQLTGPILGFKSFWKARKIIAGIEIMHMICKEQMDYHAS